MRTLDKYVIRLFLTNYVILLTVFMSLFVVVDLLLNMDEFVEAGQNFSEARGGSSFGWMLWVIADYYLPIIVVLYTFFTGLLVNAGLGFTFMALARSRELLGMLTGGISMFRIAAPALAVGCLLNALCLPLQEFIIPPLAPKLERGKSEAKHDIVVEKGIYFAPDSRGQLLSASQISLVTHELTEVSILVRDDSLHATRRITGKTAQWDGSQGWTLSDATVLDFRSGQTAAYPQLLVETDLSPNALLARKSALHLRLLSLAQLNHLSANPSADQAGIVRIMHSRFSFLVTHVLIVVMAMPLFMQRSPGVNPLVQAAKASGICLTGWIVAIVLQQMGGATLNPITSAWLPVVVFMPVSVFMLQHIET